MKELTLNEWRERGKKLYGPDVTKWKFRCPSCGNIQTIGEFCNLPNVRPSNTFIMCIGRYKNPGLKQLETRRMKTSIFSTEKPCLYSIYGLFNLAETVIVNEKGKKWYVFEFADGGNNGT